MLNFFTSTVGKKYLMGLTGLIWAGFVFAHMAGNMLIFVSADAYNAYGHALVSGYIIYAAEAVLIASLLVHVFCAFSLTIQNRQARPNRYAATPNGEKGATVASKTMAVQGSLVLFFIITHLMTFKFGAHYTTIVNGVEMRDLAKLMVEVFQQPGYVFWYVISLLVLMTHLRHGIGSLFQSFGLLERRHQPGIKKISWAYAVVVTVGFLSQPIYVYLIANK